MARLHEYQGKALLAQGGIAIPRGGAASSPGQAADVARSLGGIVVIKVQAWTTGRAAAGGVGFASTPAEAESHAARMLTMSFGNFPVTEVLIEEKLAIAQELFVSLAIDEKARAPVMLLSAAGGSGVEERAGTAIRLLCSVNSGPDPAALRNAITSLGVAATLQAELETVLRNAFNVARNNEARSLEINPLVITAGGTIVAADCRITIDDYAVARHPELAIEIARELDHPPTPLERVAYRCEQDDHRGTFFFAQMHTSPTKGSRGLIGFHGAGGGGSMMSMDAITHEGFTIANFCDTSGNPSPAKVYRASRVILAQPGLVGYFGSGSGVANQEQYWSAYGLAKAFWEMQLNIPAVIRLGGNTEDRAIDILHSVNGHIAAHVEGYRKTDTPAKIASRFAALVADSISRGTVWHPHAPRRPDFVGSFTAHKFPVKGGTLWIDAAAWQTHHAAIIARSNGLLTNAGSVPELTVSASEFLGKDSDMIACEVECRRDAIGGPDGAVFVELSLELPSPN